MRFAVRASAFVKLLLPASFLLATAAHAQDTQAVGSTSEVQIATVTITTAGTTSATLGTAIQVVLQGTPGLDFTYVAGGTCAVSTAYSVGDTCTVDYTFKPMAPGLRMGAVVLSSGTTVLGTNYIARTASGPLAVISPGTISTYAGSGTQCTNNTGACGDGGSATASGAELFDPNGVALDAANNLYIADGNRIRKVTPAGILSTVAGSGTPCSTPTATCGDGGSATASTADLNGAVGMAVDGAGNLYIGDATDNRVRKVTAATGILSTVAGSGTMCFPATAACGDGGSATATGAELNYPYGVAVDGAGNLYIADVFDARIRKVTAATGILSTVAGTGATCINSTAACGDGGSATATGADLYDPEGVAVDGAGNLYIADSQDNRIRKVTVATGIITTVAGNGTGCSISTDACGDGGSATAANLNFPTGVTLDSAGNLYITDFGDFRIRKVTAATGIITTVAGSGNYCSGGTGTICGDGGSATASAADLAYPYAVVLDGVGNLYIGDYYDYRIRKVTAAATLTFASTPVGSSSAQQVVMLSNDGNSSLTLSSLTAGNTNANFSGAGTTCSTSSPITSGGTCNLGVVFAPTSVGNPLTGSAVVTDNSLSGSTQIVPVSGVSTALTATFGTMTFSPAATEPQGTSQIITISDTVTYSDVRPTGAVKYVLNGVTYTATCTTTGSPETCTYAVPAATIAALAVNTYTVTASLAADTVYGAANGTSGTFHITARTFTSLTATGYPSPAVITEGATVTVKAYDQNGNVDPLFLGTVTLTSSDAQASLPAAYTYTATDAGVHVFSVTLNSVGTESITATSGSVTGSQTGILTGDAIWVLNAAGTLDKVSRTGSLLTSGVGTSGTAASAGGAAFDHTGNVWSVRNSTNTLYFANALGSGTASYTGGGLSGPSAIAVDGASHPWVANATGNTVSEFTNSGTAVSSSSGFGSSYESGQTLSAPSAIVIDQTGGVWVANKSTGSLTHIVSAAAPVVTPLSTGTKDGTLGTKP